MKSSNFVDPADFSGITKQELLEILKKRFSTESVEWLGSIIVDTPIPLYVISKINLYLFSQIP